MRTGGNLAAGLEAALRRRGLVVPSRRSKRNTRQTADGDTKQKLSAALDRHGLKLRKSSTGPRPTQPGRARRIATEVFWQNREEPAPETDEPVSDPAPLPSDFVIPSAF